MPNVNQMTKSEGYPNFDPFRRYFGKSYWESPSTKLFIICDIKLLKPVLAQIVARHGKKDSRNLVIVVLESSRVVTHGS